jgi:hypothetical protein
MAITSAGLIAAVGQLGDAAVAAAAERRAAIPEKLAAAARDSSQTIHVILALMLGAEAPARVRQIEMIRAESGLPPGSADKTAALLNEMGLLDPGLRLPLFALSFPALRQRTPDELRRLAAFVDKLSLADGHVTTFEYALSRLLRLQLYEVLAPQARRVPLVAPKLFSLRAEAQALFSVVAREGSVSEDKARAAYECGMRKLFPMDTLSYASSSDWSVLDRSLIRLDMLAPLVKQDLIAALVATVSYDRVLTASESELLRVVCGNLHCPLPPLMISAA